MLHEDIRRQKELRKMLHENIWRQKEIRKMLHVRIYGDKRRNNIMLLHSGRNVSTLWAKNKMMDLYL